MDDLEAPTPRESATSLQRGPIWAGLAGVVLSRCKIGKARKTGHVSPREVDLEGATELARMAREAQRLVLEFEAWSHELPPPGERLDTTARLRMLQARAEELVPEAWMKP